MKSVTQRSLPYFLNPTTLQDYLELTKPGITMLVLASMLVGFLLGSAGQIDFLILFHAAVGTIFIAAGTAAHNQYIERNLDRYMSRTSNRPLPMAKISESHAVVFSLSLIFGGLLYLILMVNPVAGAVSAITALLYLGAYTPMKQLSSFNIWIGAIPGALPPVGGWAAATGTLADPGMWILFGVVFLWQVPHVAAIAWLSKEDYENAGFRMVPQNDSTGVFTALSCLLCLILLLPVSYGLFALGLNSWIYLIGALISGLYFLWPGIRFLQHRSKENAKKVLFGSLIYLPAVWFFILIDEVAFLLF